MTDTVLVQLDWDSGIVTVWTEAKPGTPADPVGRYPNGGSGPVLPIPRDVWERYVTAADELYAAEEAVDKARYEALEAIQADQP